MICWHHSECITANRIMKYKPVDRCQKPVKTVRTKIDPSSIIKCCWKSYFGVIKLLIRNSENPANKKKRLYLLVKIVDVIRIDNDRNIYKFYIKLFVRTCWNCVLHLRVEKSCKWLAKAPRIKNSTYSKNILINVF